MFFKSLFKRKERKSKKNFIKECAFKKERKEGRKKETEELDGIEKNDIGDREY
jgi:hypothetical protein